MRKVEAQLIAEEISKLILSTLDRVMSTRQVAEYLDVSEETIRERVKQGKIPYHKRGGKLYFSQKEINEYYIEHRARPQLTYKEIKELFSI